MILILSDTNLNIDNSDEITFIDLSEMKISGCTGCFGCWIKTPGKCVIRDDAVKIYPLIAKSDKLIYVSKIKYGSYDSIMKTMLERAIPVQKAFIRIHCGETHHVQRDVAQKNAKIIIYGHPSEHEKNVFERLIARNALNMSFKKYEIIYSSENDLEKTLSEEISKWHM